VRKRCQRQRGRWRKRGSEGQRDVGREAER